MRPDELDIGDVESLKNDEKGLYIMKAEVEKAQNEMRPGKACGVDEISVKMWKFLGDEGAEGIIHLCNLIYEKGELPEFVNCNDVY